MLTTYCKAELGCRWCDRSGVAWIPSRLGDRGATYKVGDCYGDDIAAVDFEDTSLVVREPAPDEPVRVLMWWSCEHCGRSNFVEGVFANQCVQALEPVELDEQLLQRVHYISGLLREVVEDLIGEPVYSDAGLAPDWLSRLRAALAGGRRWGDPG